MKSPRYGAKKFLNNILMTVLAAIGLMWVSLAEAEESKPNPYQVSFVPGIAYSTYDGVGLGGIIGLGVPLSKRWYLTSEVGGSVFTKSGRTQSYWAGGFEYNFSDDLSNTGFVSFGVDAEYGFESETLFDRGYVGGGYRWKISDKYPLSWSPLLRVAVGDRNESRIGDGRRSYGYIAPVRFTYLF